VRAAAVFRIAVSLHHSISCGEWKQPAETGVEMWSWLKSTATVFSIFDQLRPVWTGNHEASVQTPSTP